MSRWPAACAVTLRVLRLSAVAGMAICAAALAAVSVAATPQPKAWHAGTQYVAPPFVAGAKVRTPETIESTLLEQIAKQQNALIEAVALGVAKPARLLETGKIDFALVAVADAEPVAPGTVAIPVRYSVRPMAIMRSDTDIKTWAQLKGRTVCLSEGSPYAGSIAQKYGAIEKIRPAPADSLLALRTGGCDAAVHDDVMLNELSHMPEWQKFSARLPAGPRKSLMFIARAHDTDTVSRLRRAASQWNASRYLGRLDKSRGRDIAFEVYLDQNVPDCH